MHPSRSDGSEFSRRCCGPQVLDALIISRIGDMRELLLTLRNHDGREGGEPNCTPGVPFRWTVETAPRYCGPAFGHFWCFEVRGFEMYNDIKPSPFELATAEKPTRLDLTPHVLWMDGYYSSLHTIWA
jgi:hypothetical protein